MSMGKIITGLISIALIQVFTTFGQTQSNCPNSDFIQGNFSNWQGFYGDFWNPSQYDGFDPDGHVIMRDPLPADPNTCGGLNPIPPGGTFSARLGDDKHDSHADQLRYLIHVTEETNLFIYKYAVVLEDPGHDPGEQPNFTIEVADSSGLLIDSVCGYYFVFAQQGMPTWHSCGEVIWKDWTTVGIDLSEYMGQTVSIKFTSRDCSIGGHFGYAYLSAFCSQVRIVYGSCPGDTVATLTAPPGFSYLWSTGEASQSIIIRNPVAGQVDSCILTSVNGCKVTVKGVFQPTVVKADFGFSTLECAGSVFAFHDSTTVSQNAITGWRWDFGDGSVPVENIEEPDHVYNSAGMFTATLIATSSEGCRDTASHEVTVIANPVIAFRADPFCGLPFSGDTIFFDQQTQLTAGQGSGHYLWSTGDTLSTITVTEEGLYAVTVNNSGICYAADSITLLQCEIPLMMPNAFTPDNDGLNDLFRPATRPEDVSGFHMIISDRWGEIVSETNDMKHGWDGTIKGEPAPVGVYAYIVTYSFSGEGSRQLTGTVTLVR